MDWKDIRAHYVRALRTARDRGLTQQKVAAAGGLKGQNYISKIKTAPRLGPAVELFIRAIEGLGIPVSVFFAELEGRQPPVVREHQLHYDAVSPPLKPTDHDSDRTFIVNAVIETLQRGAAASVQTPRPRRRKKRG